MSSIMGNVAIITARGGSKRIPRKNIKSFLGKPIIAYSIEVALESGLFDTVMVSTDDNEIAEVAKAYGASVPFMRSAANSDDFAGTAVVIHETLLNYNKSNIFFEYACCIYPTAPLISPVDISTSFELMKKNGYRTVFPVAAFSYPVQRALQVNTSGKIEMIWPENMKKRSQDLTPAYHDAGQFYWLHVNEFMEDSLLFTDNSGPYIMDEVKVQDIDNTTDWVIAELKYKYLQSIKMKA